LQTTSTSNLPVENKFNSKSLSSRAVCICESADNDEPYIECVVGKYGCNGKVHIKCIPDLIVLKIEDVLKISNYICQLCKIGPSVKCVCEGKVRGRWVECSSTDFCEGSRRYHVKCITDYDPSAKNWTCSSCALTVQGDYLVGSLLYIRVKAFHKDHSNSVVSVSLNNDSENLLTWYCAARIRRIENDQVHLHIPGIKKKAKVF
jgi:hypothetical protein